MAFTRPSLTTIIDRIKGDFKSGLGLSTILRRSFLDVFAKAFGGASHTMHGHVDYAILKKFFPDTGDIETVTKWGTIFSTPRNEAQRAELTIEVTGTTGGSLTAGTIFTRSDGVTYSVKTTVAVPAADTASATIVENEDETVGADGNLDNGSTVTLQSPVAGIDSDATVTATEIEGEDIEDAEDYRTRVLERLGFPPAGGTVADYIAFAKKITGVTRVWVLPNHLGEGTVGVAFVEDGNAPASIIPSEAKVAEVQEQLLEDEPQGTGGSTAFAPSETVLTPEIRLKPFNDDVKAAVIEELEDLLSREAQVRGAVDPDQVGQGVTFDGRIKLSQINEAISLAAGETDHILVSPTADVKPAVGGLVTLGTPIFTPLL